MTTERPTAASRPSKDERRAAERAERFELLGQLQDLLEPVMVALGLVFLGLLIVEYAGPPLGAGQAAWLGRAQTAIYWVFVGDFALRFLVAPEKGRFLRANWLPFLSLLLPALRPLRAVRALRAARAGTGPSTPLRPADSGAPPRSPFRIPVL